MWTEEKNVNTGQYVQTECQLLVTTTTVLGIFNLPRKITLFLQHQ